MSCSSLSHAKGGFASRQLSRKTHRPTLPPRDPHVVVRFWLEPGLVILKPNHLAHPSAISGPPDLSRFSKRQVSRCPSGCPAEFMYKEGSWLILQLGHDPLIWQSLPARITVSFLPPHAPEFFLQSRKGNLITLSFTVEVVTATFNLRNFDVLGSHSWAPLLLLATMQGHGL